MQIRHKNGVQIKSNGQKVMAQTKNIPDYPALFFVFLATASVKGENFSRHQFGAVRCSLATSCNVG